jgi:hypothetical protein
MQVPFDHTGMYMAYLPMQLWASSGTFCSKHITQALQHGGVIAGHYAGGLNPSLSTPSTLLKHVNAIKGRAITSGIPARMAGGGTVWTGRMSRDMLKASTTQGQGAQGAGDVFGQQLLSAHQVATDFPKATQNALSGSPLVNSAHASDPRILGQAAGEAGARGQAGDQPHGGSRS